MGLEDFYDIPSTEVDLVGGLHDGKRFPVPDGMTSVLVPNPPPPVLGFPAPYPATGDVTIYRFTGSIADDGRRIFQAS